MIIAPNSRSLFVAKLLFYSAFKISARRGYTNALGEIYELTGYTESGVFRPLKLFNKRSAAAATSSFGVQTFRLPKKTKRVVGTETDVDIEAFAFAFDYSHAIPKLERLLAAERIVVVENSH
ncbi:MAG: hypothetical protein LBM98_10300 [Oscillospiraceae bacterium]|jgi:hypothetical protein|nr:hypothetical protein [Oscillospiraceae bacterium]